MKAKGINHLDLVCRDMAETVAFYTQAPGIASVKDFPAEPRSAVGSMNHVAPGTRPGMTKEYWVRPSG